MSTSTKLVLGTIGVAVVLSLFLIANLSVMG